MSITIEPIKPEERPRCQYCGKGLQPGQRCRESLSTFDGVKDPEGALAALKTNRRVVRVKRIWRTTQSRFDAEPERSLSSIEVVYMPRDAGEWDAYDSLFCTLNCARGFARAAHLAGYRIKGAKA